MIGLLGLFIGMLLLSAFFSASETALLSLSPVNIVRGHKSRLSRLYQIKEKLITTCLIGNTITIVAATLTLEKVLLEYNGFIIKTLALIGEILIFFFLAEMLPKAIARQLNNRFLSIFSFLLEFFRYLLFPLTFIFNQLNMILSKVLPKEQSFARKDVYAFIEHHVEDKESNLPSEWMMLEKTKVKELMTQLSDFVSLDASETVNQVMDLIEESSYSRYPVYESRGDQIIGYVSVVDFLSAQKSTRIIKLLRPAIFIPENLSSKLVLERMQRERAPIVFIVNEYGSVQGLVSLEDIGEHFVGDIVIDEQTHEKSYITQVHRGKYLLDGSLDIDDFNKKFSKQITKNGFETLTGLIIDTLGYIPKKGQTFVLQGCKFRIADSSALTVEKVYFLEEENKKAS